MGLLCEKQKKTESCEKMRENFSVFESVRGRWKLGGYRKWPKYFPLCSMTLNIGNGHYRNVYPVGQKRIVYHHTVIRWAKPFFNDFGNCHYFLCYFTFVRLCEMSFVPLGRFYLLQPFRDPTAWILYAYWIPTFDLENIVWYHFI